MPTLKEQLQNRDARVTILPLGICCMVVVRNGKVTPDSAPVFRWAYGKTWEYVRQWIFSKGGFIDAYEGT